MRDVVLVDLSSIAHPIWHTSGSEPDPNAASQKIVARIRSLASSSPHVAICCDKGKSFRHELSSAYKANRPESDASLQHQITLAREILKADGFPVWAVSGFEADDLIASACAYAIGLDDTTVSIISADKDLLQLVGPRVKAINVRDGSEVDSAKVKEKFGVAPGQMRDLLTLMGDSSDNVKGAKGIGPAKAANLLAQFGSIDALYEKMNEGGAARLNLGITPAMVTSLREFEAIYPETRKLITLRMDVELPFDDIFKPRQPKELTAFGMDEGDDMETETTTAPQPGPIEVTPAPVAMVRHEQPEVLAPAPAEWEKHLEPRSMGEVVKLSKYIFESRLFSAYGTPQAVLTTLMAGRELGLQSMAALRAIHIVEGKPSLSSDLIRALVLRSGLAESFRCTERTATRCTFVTKRHGDPEAFVLAITIEEMRQAWPKDQTAWDKSAWGKNPADMLVARAGSKLARLVYPDVVHGIYTREELEEGRELAA